METCTVETGLLRKKPCGHPSVTHCANCERGLCAEHAVAQLTDTGKKSGKFMCKECDVAAREHEKSMAALARSEKHKEPPPPAKKPAEPAKGAPAESKNDDGAIDFTPGTGGDSGKK